MFSDADLRPPTRETLIRRGRKIADAYGMTVLTVDRRSFVARADVDRLAQGSAA